MFDYRSVILLLLVSLIFISLLTPIGLYKVEGDSMEPTLKPGDLVVAMPSDNYQVGDIIIFKNERQNLMVVHRIVNKTENDNYITKGDNNDRIDQRLLNIPSVKENIIVGKVVSVRGVTLRIPLVGLLIGILREHFLVVLTLMITIIFLIELRNND